MGLIINPANDIIKMSSLNKGLVGHWPLDKESLQSATIFADKTPHENKGTSANVPVFTTDRMGQADRAMSFDGANDYIDCGDDESLDITDAITMSAWVKTTDKTLSYQVITGKRHTVDGIQYMIRLQNDDIKLAIQGMADGGLDALNVIAENNRWYHIVGTYDGQNAYIYLDGLEVATIADAVGFTTNTADVFIGRRTDDPSQFFDGSLADVRIYNRALSETEITTLYDAYRPKLSAGSLQKGLVFDMPLTSTYTKDETAGSEVMTDRTPYSNDGQNSGGDVDTDHTTFISANSDNVRIPDSESLSQTSAMTAMVWVNGAKQDYKIILSHYDYGVNQRSVYIGTSAITDDNIIIGVSDDGTYDAGHKKIYNSSIVAFDDTWHLIGFTFDGSLADADRLKLFVDGVKDTDPAKTHDDAITTIHNSTADTMIGCYLTSDTPTGFFAGDISGAKMWNRALTDAEWLLAYDKEKGLYL